jgi:hypothetical protein
MSGHEHASKVVQWGIDDSYRQIPKLYGCIYCDETNPTPWISNDESSEHSQHTEYVDDCFGCKVRTLELNTGDAGRADSMSQKKWDKELQSYRDARSQGIQPAGTSTQAIREAHQASETLGKAYNADVMPATSKITKQTAKSFTEAGVV